LAASLGALGIDGTALKASTDLSAKRKAFEPVSNALVAMVKEIGADRVGNVYVAHCPMAFDYEGADWLSPEPSILNPYFGEEMLTCGTVTENLSFDPKQAARKSGQKPGAQHEHKH
jgi:Cu(I)/Ag(I) efflux system membrane fusion protein